MDKYTVDLDQVLNDFEYSELTDQHESNKQLSGASYGHNNFKNTNVKHSINNVFHSLNEYLNSDITPKTEIRPLVLEPSVSSQEITSNNGTETIPSVPNNHHLIQQSIIRTEVAVPDIPSEINNLQDPSSELVKPHVVDSHENGEVIDNHKEPEEVILVDTAPGEVLLFDVSSEPIIDETLQKPLDQQSSDAGTYEVTEKKNDEEEKEEKIEEVVEVVKKTMEELEPVEEQVPEEFKKCDEESFEQAKKTECEVKVGFDDNIDLDESELNKYLDELEQEFEAESKEGTEEPKHEEPSEQKTRVEKQEDAVSTRPNILPLDSQASEESKPIIDLIGEPGSTPYNNVYVNKELPQEKAVENSDTDRSTSASPTFSDISTETNSSCTPSTDTVNEETQNGEGSKSDDTVVPETSQTEDKTGDCEEPSKEAEQDAPPTEGSNPSASDSLLGKEAPLWIPDAEATACMHCSTKFTVIKRRHHCRACGYLLCSKCCGLRHRLEYLDEVARVCNKCFEVLSKEAGPPSSSSSESSPHHALQPNPNNPLEYCSTVPPHQQVANSNANPPAVMVPVGVLKRKGSNKGRSNKSVMFCDGIRPGSDLTNLDSDFSYVGRGKEVEVKGTEKSFSTVDVETNSFIPKGEDLPPTVTFVKSDVVYSECSNGPHVVEMLRNETLQFALQSNLYVHLRIINMDCCINKVAWCFSTEGLINVGQDEIVILLELMDDEKSVPKEMFFHINNIYLDACKGTSVKELGLSLHNTSNFLGSKNHAGFVYIKPTFQCLQNIIKPHEPYLIGVLIHRWETPWAKLFPLRLILRLGAEYRYYPSPLISNRYRDSVFVEIGHTIINLLADFRNFSYTLPQIRGLTISMEDKNTTVTIPSNRYDQVMKSMNNSSDHILAFAGNFSSQADSHLVCIQDTQSNENAYSTHAINIHNKPRKVTGASFIVFNGALKSSSGLTAKSSIVEDGLMIQIPSEHMAQIRESLRNMKNHTIQCGCINAASDETVNIVWGDADVNFNENILSPIDNKPMEGIPSIRVHNGKDYVNGNRLIRWTEVFIVQNEGEASRNQDPVDISKVSETIAKATCTALVKYLDLLVSNNFYKIGIRAKLNAYFVAYSAGSNATKLAPIYMESLDNELVPVLHRNATSDCDENTIILELIFRILRN